VLRRVCSLPLSRRLGGSYPRGLTSAAKAASVVGVIGPFPVHVRVLLMPSRDPTCAIGATWRPASVWKEAYGAGSEVAAERLGLTGHFRGVTPPA
jgi:hypothetical protein